MAVEIRVPNLPESVADATLVAWRKQPGDAVSRDENLADLETDKVVLEVPSPVNGVLKEIRTPIGTSVKSGELLAIVEEGSSAVKLGATASGAATAPSAVVAAAATAVVPASGNSPAFADSGRLSPSARRLVEENKLDRGNIAASGRDGLITKSDVVAHLGKAAGSTAPATPPAPAAPPALAAAPNVTPNRATATPSATRATQRVPMTRLRQRIAERMVQAQATQALLTSFNEVDLSAVNEMRARYKDRFEKAHGVKLGFMSFFVKASVEALKKFPIVNASVEGNDIVYHEYYDLGVAVSTERGLIVPVVRDADNKSFAELESAIAAFATRARAGTLGIEDLTGGTFTITNGGVFGSLMSTPIVNAPQSAILGMHKIQDRPMAVGGQVVIKPMMYLAVTYDHRIIDGRDAVQFLVAIKDCLEDPGRMLIGI